jgi:pyrimidine operon attenuation protein / uracil phosphoribosyltransferase
MDITFYRDDFRRREKPLQASNTKINFPIEKKKIVLIDDVLFTGRTIRAALDALLDFGRPEHVELLVLIDRRFTRDLPIQANYIGKTIDSIESEHVKVEWKEQDGADKVWILTENEKQK